MEFSFQTVESKYLM